MFNRQRGAAAEPLSPKGLLGWLYDMSFTRHHAPHVLKVVYWLVTGFFSLVAIFALVLLFRAGGLLRTVLGVIVTVVAYVVYLVIARILLELLMVIFQMAEDVGAIRTTAGSAGAGRWNLPAVVGMPPPAAPGRAGTPVPAGAPAEAAPPAPGAAATAAPVDMGPHIEEIIGYGKEEAASPSDLPAPDDPSSPLSSADSGEGDYPPEAGGDPWIT